MAIPIQRPDNPALVYEAFYVPAIFSRLAPVVLEGANLKPGQRVLDLACGTGIVARFAAPVLGTQGRVMGLDLRAGMLDVARSLPARDGAPIEWRQGDATALDLPDASFDAVFCQQGLQFFSDKQASLREMRRVLAPHGTMLLAAWQGIEQQGLLAQMFDIELALLADYGIRREDAEAPFSLGDRDALRRLCVEAGWRAVELTEHTIDVTFAAENFVENLEFAYAAVIPAFAEDVSRFDAFVDQVTDRTQAIREQFRRGDSLSFEMKTHIVRARP